MPNPKKNLTTCLKAKLKGAKRVAILGVGSELKGDDAAGYIAAKNLARTFYGERSRTIKNKLKHKNIRVFIGGEAPENLTGEIKKFLPEALIIIDAADFAKKAGFTALLDPKELGGISFSTHRLPLNIFADYLCKSFPCEIIIVAIQPRSLAFGAGLCKEVESSTQEVCAAIKEVLA